MKKFISLFLVLALTLTVSVAFAASSKSTSDTSSSSSSSSSGATTAPKTTPEVAVTTTALSAGAASLVSAMNENVANGQSPLSALPEDVQAELADLGDDVTANEATGIDVSGFVPGVGDQDVEFSFATEYAEGTELKALITCYDEAEEIKEQFVLPASPLPNGKVKVHFTEKVLKAMDEAASSSIIIFQAKK